MSLLSTFVYFVLSTFVVSSIDDTSSGLCLEFCDLLFTVTSQNAYTVMFHGIKLRSNSPVAIKVYNNYAIFRRTGGGFVTSAMFIGV